VQFYAHVCTSIFKKCGSAEPNMIFFWGGGRVQWTCTLHYISFSPYLILRNTQPHLYIDMSLERFLQEAYRPALPILLTTFFCNLKVPYTFRITTPQDQAISQVNMKPCKVHSS
jgi:hypothetical protein